MRSPTFATVSPFLEPGLVWIPQWQPIPDDVPEDPSKYWALVGVGRSGRPAVPSAAPD